MKVGLSKTPKATGTFKHTHRVKGMANVGGSRGPVNTPFVSRVVGAKGR